MANETFDKIMSIYYGVDKLPYKDSDRQVHYPIASGSSTYIGENNTTKVRFYVDRIGGNRFTWVATIKKPDGSLVSAPLGQPTSDGYVELDLSFIYVDQVGAIYISLTGYTAEDVSITRTNDVYEISGNPQRVVSGSIKLNVNYAPVLLNGGSTIKPTEYQLILALLSTKLGGENSIVKYNDITNVGNGEIPIANLLDNTIVLDLATKKIKKYNKTANQTIGTFTDFVLADFDAKVNKTSQPRKIYGTNENGQPVLYSTIVCNPNSVVLYDSDGYLSTERTPSQNYHLTNKEYVDSQIKANASHYITKNASGNAFGTYNELENADTFYCGGVEFTPTKNDYCLVRDDETQGHTTTRYIYQNGQWEFQYVVNETPLTQAQLNAINSGITSALVSKLGYYNYDTNGNIVPINVNQSLGSEEQPYKYVWATRFRFTTDFYISKDTDYSIFINVNGKELHTNGNFTPTTDNTYNVGSKSFAWKNVFIKGYISNDTRSVRVEELQKSKKETTQTTLQNNETTLTSEEEMFITQPITTLVIDKLKDLDVGYAKSFAINFITGSTFSGITLPNKVQKITFSVGANNEIFGSSTEEDIICDFALGTPHLQPNTEYKLIIKKSVVSGNYLAYLI